MFNKPQTTKVNLSIRQVLHKATLFSYLSDLKTIINNDLLPEIQNLKKLQLQENSSFKECNARTVRLNEIVDSISTLLKNFLPLLVTQLLFSGKTMTGELKFEDCVTKTFYKEKLQNIGIMSHLVTILKHDNYVITREMSQLLKKMGLLPSLAVCMASDFVINSPHFEDLFIRIRNIFSVILGAKGGSCFIATNAQEVKLILNILEYHQQDLKRMEAVLPESQRVYHEDNILGIFDYGNEFDMNILNGIKENIDEKRFSKRLVRIGIFARQLSATLKYIIHATNCLDKICVRKMADDFDEVLLQNLSQIAHIATKNRISNQALRSMMQNDFVVHLLTSIMNAKTLEDVYFKNAEIALISEILYSIFLNDNGKLPLLWAEALNKIIPPISKIVKDEKNNEYFAEAKELKLSLQRLESYMEPIFTYSVVNEKNDGIMLLLIEFKKKCRYIEPKLDLQQKSTQNQKWEANGLPKHENDLAILRENILYFGNDTYPESPLIYIESALNILNIMASYYNNNIIHYLKKDIFSGVNMIASTCCFFLEKFLANDILNDHTAKILTKKNIFINSYLRALSKSLYLIYQRLEYKLGNDENVYDNTELLQALIHCYCLFFNFVPEYSSILSQVNINKHLVMLNMELIVSILSIWSELSGFTETMIYELCYRFYASMRNRPAILYLMGTILEMIGASDKAIFNEALKALISPYNPRKYERKPDAKEKEMPGQKERKPLILLKFRHHEEMFHDLLQKDKADILLDYMFNSLFEFKSGIFETSLDKFLDSLFQMTDFKTLKDLMVIFEKKWKYFYENRNDFLSDDIHKNITFGRMLYILEKLSKSNEFKTYMIEKKFASEFIRILNTIDSQLNPQASVRKISSDKKLRLANLKKAIFKIFINLCDHEIGISSSENCSQEHGFFLDNIPSISELQDMLKIVSSDLNFPPEFMSLYGGEKTELKDENEEIQGDINRVMIYNLYYGIQIVEKLSKNVVGQSILMYTEYSKTVRSPSPILNFTDLVINLQKIIPSLNFQDLQFDELIVRIVEKFLYSYYMLSYNTLTNHFINNEKRKLAIKALLPKNKSVKVSSADQSMVTEALEGLTAVLSEKKKELLSYKSQIQNARQTLGSVISILEASLFEIICITNYLNSPIPEPKKDDKKEEKLYVESENPKELEQRFKEVEEKEANKTKHPVLFLRPNSTSSNKLATQAMSLIEKALDDLFGKLNTPWTAQKKGRLVSISKDLLGLHENRISQFNYSHFNDYEVVQWDYDGSISNSRNKVDAYNTIKRLPERKKIAKTFKREDFCRKLLLQLFGTENIFDRPVHHDIFFVSFTVPLDYYRLGEIQLDEKPIVLMKKKLTEKKVKKPIASESYINMAVQQQAQNDYNKPNLTKSGSLTINRSASSGRPSSMHVDDYNKFHQFSKTDSKEITPIIQTNPIKSEGLSPTQQIIKDEKELIRTASDPGKVTGINPNIQVRADPLIQPFQGDMMNFPGNINPNLQQQPIKMMQGGPVDNRMQMGNMQNIQGPFQQQRNFQGDIIRTQPTFGGNIPNMNVNLGMNQGLNQGLGQPLNQGINPINQGLNQGMNQPINQGLNQNMNQGLNQGMNQGMMQPNNMMVNMVGPIPMNQNMGGMNVQGNLQGGIQPGYVGGMMGQGGVQNFQPIMQQRGNINQMKPFLNSPINQHGIQGFPNQNQNQMLQGQNIIQNQPMQLQQSPMQQQQQVTPTQKDQTKQSTSALLDMFKASKNVITQQQPSQNETPTQTPVKQQNPNPIQTTMETGSPKTNDLGQDAGIKDGTNVLTQQEKKLLKEIIELKNKKDPRCATRIKDILLKHPKIKDFIITQQNTQQKNQ